MRPIVIEDCILTHRDIGTAISLLSPRVTSSNNPELQDELEAVRKDYRLMCSAYLEGMRDPKANEMYDSLLRRVYRLYNNVRLASIVKNRPSFARAKSVADSFGTREADVRAALESFVQEVVMTSLLPENERKLALERTYAMHQRYMENLFNCLLVSRQWSDGKGGIYSDMLLSPTIDKNDALLIVSGMTLALMNVFDTNKWLTLLSIYKNSTVEELRQRALVGMMLTLPHKDLSMFPEIVSGIDELCGSESCRREMKDVQMQLYFCFKAKSDSADIQKNIMPTLLKNNRFEVTQTGIVEKDEDSLNDILESAEADAAIKDVEAKFNQMADMQKQGSDIYFGGFSQMKRFSFFFQLSNWFVPFSLDHPDVRSCVKGDFANVVERVVDKSPFCNSDKYSFALALSSVYDKLPAAVKEMLSGGAGMVGAPVSESARSTTAYLRRAYLQDIYRFFMLYRDKKDFRNPFEAADGESLGMLFFANPVLAARMQQELVEMEKFLFGQHEYDMVLTLYAAVIDLPRELRIEGLSLCALTYKRQKKYAEAYAKFKEVLELSPEHELALRGRAESAFWLGKYEEASGCFKHLIEMFGEKKFFMLFYGLSLVNMDDEIKKGLGVLYKLDFECEADVNVRRALAWGCLMDKRPQESEKIYETILDGHGDVSADLLNAGYSKWMQMKNREAVELFRKYRETLKNVDAEPIIESFNSDDTLLGRYGVGMMEKMLMASLVEDDAKEC